MTHEDAAATASLHVAHLRFGFFPRLGKRFVQRWHRTFIDADAGWAGVVADDTGHIAGFILIATDQMTYQREVLTKYRMPLLTSGTAAMLVRPRELCLFARTRLRRYLLGFGSAVRSKTRAVPTDGPVVGVIHAIVTDPGARGRGYGRVLVSAAVEAADRRDTCFLELITAADDQPAGGISTGGAEGFYDRLGWTRVATGDRSGTVIVRFRKNLRINNRSDAALGGQ